MVEIDVDVSALSAPEQRMLEGLVPLLDAHADGVMRLHPVHRAGIWRLQAASVGSALDLLAPTGVIRTQLSRPIVLGALKRMMSELKSGTPARLAPKPSEIQTQPSLNATRIRRALAGPAITAKESSSVPPDRRDSSGFSSDPNTTANRPFRGSSDLRALLTLLIQGGPGLFEIRFQMALGQAPSKTESIRIDRGSNTFRCRGFNRSELNKRLQTGLQWMQLPDRSSTKSDETQASLGPLLFALGAMTARDHFILGAHTELEFQIRTQVGYAKQWDYTRIGEAFTEYSPVADVAVKLSLAPTEVLACLNGYAALGLVRTRTRTKPNNPPTEEKPSGGLFSKIRQAFS
jgi:hypothetical protein